MTNLAKFTARGLRRRLEYIVALRAKLVFTPRSDARTALLARILRLRREVLGEMDRRAERTDYRAALEEREGAW